ncbi:MAG: hypothetical protein IBJ08_10595 [Pseudomonas sp.]|nr:hypothetical protein [Pseudomonas sp.]
MVDRYQIAELLTALWRLGAPDERMPSSHGILDRALFELREVLPDTLVHGLTFSNSSVGLRCLQLPSILLAAQEALLTSEPNPTYLSTQVTLDDDLARQIAVGAGLSTSEARRLGGMLRDAVHAIKGDIGASLQPVAA